MRHTLRCLALALVPLALALVARAQEAPAPASPAPDVTVAEESLRAAEQAFADAFACHDIEAFAAHVHPEAVFLGRTPLRGRDAVMEVWGKLVAADPSPFSWRPERVIVSSEGTVGMTTGPVFAPDGTWVGAFASSWRRKPGGEWRIVFDLGPKCPPCRASDGGPTPVEAPPAPAQGEPQG